MWIFGKHRHINPDTLSQYLDDRLSLRARERVDRAVAACVHCREELESRRVTLSLLRELPPILPPRSFTLAAPPVTEPTLAAGSATSRLAALPTWAYAGAAAIAGIALAFLALVDAAGLTTPQSSFSDADAIVALPQAAAEPASPAAQSQPAPQTEAMAAPAAARPAPQQEQTLPQSAEPSPTPVVVLVVKEVIREVPVEVTTESVREETVELTESPSMDSMPSENTAALAVASSVSSPTPAPQAASVTDSVPSTPTDTAIPQSAKAETEAAAPPDPQGPAGPSGYANGDRGPQGAAGSSGGLPPTHTPIPTPTATLLPTLTPTPTAAPPTATPTLNPTATPPLDTDAAVTGMASGAAGGAMPSSTAIEPNPVSEPSTSIVEQQPSPESIPPTAGSKIVLRLLQGIAAALTVALLIAFILKLRRNHRLLR